MNNNTNKVEFMVNLNMVSNYTKFADKAGKCDCDVMVSNVDRHYRVDGASILGLVSLDLTRPVRVEVDAECADWLKSEIEEMIVE